MCATLPGSTYGSSLGARAGRSGERRACADCGRARRRTGRRLLDRPLTPAGRRSERPQTIHQILLSFTGTEISRRAVDAALRLARAEEATLMPAYMAAVPKQLPLDCSIPAGAAKAMPMLEAIEQRATAQGVDVDSRIERGRSYRHALARLLDRVVVPATAEVGAGFSGDDLVRLLEKVPAEVLILPWTRRKRFVTGPAPLANEPRRCVGSSECG